MKTCPKCNRSYEDGSLNFCLDDGEWLQEEGSEAPTRSIPPEVTDDPAEARTRLKTSRTEETEVLPTRAIKDRSDGSRDSAKRTYLYAGAALVAVLAAAGYGLYTWSPFSSNQMDEAPAPEITIERLTGDGNVREAAISPDGKFLAYLEIENNSKSLRVRQIETNSSVEILKAGDFEDIDNVIFSPDGNFVFFSGMNKERKVSVYKVATLGGSPIPVSITARLFRLSPDGTKVSYFVSNPETTETSISVANSDGSGARTIIRKTGKIWIDGATAWSPDGRKLLVAQGDDGRSPDPLMSLAIYDFEDGSLKPLGEDQWENIDERSLVWDPSGEFVFFSGNRSGGEALQIYRVSVPEGEAVQITKDDNNYRGLSITADGTRLVTTDMELRSGVWVSPDLDPKNSVEVLPARGDTWSLDWTPDGRIIYISDQSGAREVWIMDADGSNQKQLTNDRIPKTEPAVSPDGRTVVYGSPIEGFQIYKVSIEGGNPSRIETGTVGPESPIFSNDGKYIAFAAWPDGKQSIFRMPAGGGPAQRLTSYFSRAPSYSPDGERIACFFLDGDDQFFSLGIFPAEGGPPVKKFSIPASTVPDRGTLWTPDGKMVTYLVSDGEERNLWAQPVEGGDPVKITDFSRPWIQRRAYSKDGKQVAITRGENLQNAVMLSGLN